VVRSKIRCVNQNVEGFTTRRGDFGFTTGWSADVACGVWCGLPLAIDPVELLMGIVREDEVVMKELIVPTVEAEIEDNA
jgi:hypothetical protein